MLIISGGIMIFMVLWIVCNFYVMKLVKIRKVFKIIIISIQMLEKFIIIVKFLF